MHLLSSKTANVCADRVKAVRLCLWLFLFPLHLMFLVRSLARYISPRYEPRPHCPQCLSPIRSVECDCTEDGHLWVTLPINYGIEPDVMSDSSASALSRVRPTER